MEIHGFTINGRLMSLNEYTRVTRGNLYASAKAKKEQEERIALAIYRGLKGWKTKKSVFINYRWVERNTRKDKDNIAFAKKFVQDALVKCGVIRGDGWHDVVGFSDSFAVDAGKPRVEVSIVELDNADDIKAFENV